MKSRNEILVTLRQHAPELQSAGLAHVRLFGSVAREEHTANSDIDLLADFTPDKTITLVTLGSLEQRLRDLLGSDVELCSAAWLKPHVRERAMREAIHAF